MASSAFTLTSGNHCCLLFPPSEGLKALREFISLFSSPKALMHVNDSAFSQGPPALLNQEEGEQTDAYLKDQRNKLLPALNLRLQLSRHHKGTVWQEAIVRPSAEAGALKGFIHSTWVSNFLPSGYSPMADPITDKIDGSAWHAEATLTLFPF